MANAAVIGFNQVVVKLEGDTPGTFVADCMINMTRGLELTTNVEEDQIPDCADDTAPATTVRMPGSKDLQVTGDGKLHITTLGAWVDWWDSGQTKNVLVEIGGEDNGGRSFAFPAVLSSFSVNGQRARYAEVNLTIVPAGAIVVADMAES